MSVVSMFSILNQQAGERPTSDPQSVEEWFASYHLSAIKAYFDGNDTLESAQASWRILLGEGYRPTALAEQVGQPLKTLYLMELAK